MEKKWLTLNSHGKKCLWSFITAISANDILTSEMWYLTDKELVGLKTDFKDAGNRHPAAYKCLTDLGVHTVMHYFPKFDPHLSKVVDKEAEAQKVSTSDK